MNTVNDLEAITAVEDMFWGVLSRLAMKNAWSKEDEVWGKLAKNVKVLRL